MDESPAVKRAILGLVIAMVLVDGEMPRSETNWLLSIVREDPLLADASEPDLCLATASASEAAREGTLRRAVENWARQIPPHLAAPVFKLALRAAFADGNIARQEANLSIHLVELLGIPDAQAANIYREVRGH